MSVTATKFNSKLLKTCHAREEPISFYNFRLLLWIEKKLEQRASTISSYTMFSSRTKYHVVFSSCSTESSIQEVPQPNSDVKITGNFSLSDEQRFVNVPPLIAASLVDHVPSINLLAVKVPHFPIKEKSFQNEQDYLIPLTVQSIEALELVGAPPIPSNYLYPDEEYYNSSYLPPGCAQGNDKALEDCLILSVYTTTRRM
ncbi:hypothetical protein DAPPUDRAFT_248448 [Daphnia pulex]|uniref:Uncharacterized protein n=1 Tax=Daphnia pulex TaxID=6669 RepID=E9GUP2_DAPPU|nr:hypothetical protein DAPPUDRAFT_248448 [Daphnia pulex]|eukprot:EFX76767.1 hypothetical protein DAPPUDRAFT_248448 [Daphnia pulex]